jgi:hypothetical protein
MATVHPIDVVKRGVPLSDALRFSVGRRSSGAGEGCVPLHALGNPFRLTSEAHRVQVVEAYARWLLVQIKNNNRQVCDALNVLVRAARKGRVELECFCAPKLCHAEVIRLVLIVVLERERWEREELMNTWQWCLATFTERWTRLESDPQVSWKLV